MAKVLFLQKMVQPMLSVLYLSASISRKGHQSYVSADSIERMVEQANRLKPDVIAITAMFTDRKWLLALTAELRRRGPASAKIIAGGILPTFDPEILTEANLDAICQGEGEEAFLEYIDGYRAVPNMQTRQGKKIADGGLRPLVCDLDALPFPDWEIYRQVPAIYKDPCKPVLTSRGCPYACTNCFHHSYKNLFEHQGKYFRTRSVDNVITECLQLKERYRPYQILFVDDVLLMDKQWCEEFLKRYKKEVALPFSAGVRIETIDEDKARLLAENGYCTSLSFGVESGDEDYRHTVLNRKITNRQIIDGAKLLHRYGIVFMTTNMACLPGETRKMVQKTIELNIRIKPSAATCTIYQPIPKTQLYDTLAGKNIPVLNLPDRAIRFGHGESSLDQPDRVPMQNLHKFFVWLVRFPFLRSLGYRLAGLPSNPLFNIIHGMGYAFIYLPRRFGYNKLMTIRQIWTAIRNYNPLGLDQRKNRRSTGKRFQ